MSNSIISSQADFALKLIRETGAIESAVISPISLSFALGMTLLGAKGNTAKEIQDAIAKDSTFDNVHNQLLNIFNFIKNTGNNDAIKMANKIYFSEDLQVFDSYKMQIQKYYNGNFQPIDFTNSEKAAEEINDFVAGAKNDEILDIVDRINKNAKMVLVNALYFEKKWFYPFTFDPNMKLFYSAPNVTKKIYMMYNSGNYNYATTKSYQFIEIPYINQAFSMFIVLPLERFGLSELLKDIKIEEFLGLMFATNSKEVDVTIPKFDAESSFELSRILQRLNINDAFDELKADFSGATDSNIYISRILHKVSVKISEEGTIAAAATVVEDEFLSYEEPDEHFIFTADHPFLYLIAVKSKNIYFIGTYFH